MVELPEDISLHLRTFFPFFGRFAGLRAVNVARVHGPNEAHGIEAPLQMKPRKARTEGTARSR